MTTVTETARKTTILPPLPKPFTEKQAPTIRLYPVSNYTFDVKEAQPEEDNSVTGRLQRLQEQYETSGMRRTCEGILVCHEHGHPYVLLLQIANTFFKLPGDYIQPDQDEITGFKQRLNERLAPAKDSEHASDPINSEWEIGDCITQWWRPNFETFMYPFIPPHISRPKECKKMFLIHLPKHKVLSVPQNMKLLAVPLFELYDNATRYGNQLAAIPLYLSRYNFEFVDSDDNVIATYPASNAN
ncbi:hypothetical protein AWJ20_4716 [Sugiyamaella lignohabitans]|uniref:Cleavage and polyadenylation specificity factor subunit 5 n=1 Tax=Sugiyamaella lignohabitans TaxID=796027 RepID=A0A167E8G4_9ASCO|nr:uncharacterized protein AWJ20_4716 [Sugiyamaella lignohabitans]ANB13770.1 hypothetical protein AWJ20_4716 [Sugiyamaella lignohabitans]